MFEIDPSNLRGDDWFIYLFGKQMHTNPLRVILQHTMDNVVSQYVLTHEACHQALHSAVYRRIVSAHRRSFRSKNRSDL